MRTLMLICFVAALAGRGATFIYPTDPGTNLPYGRNTSSGPISVPAFPYYGQTVSEVWVFQHGLLTFDGENTNPSPAPGGLPFPTSAGNEGKLIAVFWVEHGSLGDDVSYYTSTDAALLTQASHDVATYFPCEATFTPTNLFVATWDGISVYTEYDCDTTTYTNPHHHTYYYTYETTYTTYTSTYYCDTYTYVTTYCYSDSYGSSDCTSYPTYTTYCYHTYYTYTYYTTYTTTYTTWYTSTSTTTFCIHSYTYVLENSYQVALATDGTRTFALLWYDYIEWDSNYWYGVAGFNRGDGMTHLALPGSGTTHVSDLSASSNVGVPGTFAFRVDIAPTDIPCVGCECHLSGTVVTFSPAVVDAVSGSGNQKVILVERSDVGDFCRFRLQPIVKLEDGHVEVKRVIFRFGLHNNPNKYPTRLTLKTDGEKFKVGDVVTPLTFPVHEFTDPDGIHIRVQRTGFVYHAYHVTSDTCGWSFDYDPGADTVDYIGSPVVTTGLCGSCV